MPLHPSYDLQRAMLTQLRANSALATALGGPRVYEQPPARPSHPYVSFNAITVRDWSTGSGPGHRHFVTVLAVSREPGFAQVTSLADGIAAALAATLPPLVDHHLVLLRLESTELRRDNDGVTARAALTFSALTEPKP